MRERISNFIKNINPVVLILLIVMLAESILDNTMSPGEWFINKLMILPGIFIGLSFHEAAHGFVSYKLGDPTPKIQGRLTINPMKHMDPAGFIALLFIGFGWGIPVQIDPRYYKNRRLGELLVSLAGVVTNFGIAAVFALIVRLMAANMTNEFYAGLGGILIQILVYVVYINIILMIFNLLPVPPLDGFSVLTQIFNLEKYSWYYTVYKNGYFILLVLIIFNITTYIISPVADFFMNWLLW